MADNTMQASLRAQQQRAEEAEASRHATLARAADPATHAAAQQEPDEDAEEGDEDEEMDLSKFNLPTSFGALQGPPQIGVCSLVLNGGMQT